MAKEIPSQLGRYQVLEVIGKGAMGVVYLARDPALNRLVALKTFHVGGDVDESDREQFRERFLREAQSCGMLNHPNVVILHDVVELPATDSAFMAMEYVRGTNLKQLIQRGDGFTPQFITDVVDQIAAGLDYAHSRGVVHRDVKPANILLTTDGEAKITDFGIARFNASNLTHAGQLLGTPNYMAPEQIRSGEVDHRADLFSLGVLVYELLTGRKPFQGENLTVVTHRIVYEDFEAPDQYVKDLPPAVLDVLHRALAKDPADRYASARAMARELRQALAPAAAGEAAELERLSPDLSNTISTTGAPLPRRSAAAPPPPPAGSEETQPSSVNPLPEPSPAGWKQQLEDVLEQTRTLVNKMVPPEARPPRRRVLAYVAAGVAVLLVGLAVAGLAHRSLRPGFEDVLAGQRMQWASEFSGLMVAGAQELERGEAAMASDRFQQARGLLEQRRHDLEAHQQRLLAAGEEEAARAVSADIEGLASLERASSDALARAEWRRENDSYQQVKQTALTDAVDRLEDALRRRDRAAVRNAALEALQLDPAHPAATAALADLEPRQGRQQPDRRPAQEPRPPPPAAPAPAPVAAEEAPPPVAAAESTLVLDFATDLARGVLLIYLDEDQILRENFRFAEKGSFFRRTIAETGTLEKSLTVPSGAHSVRVYVSGARNRPTEVRQLDGSFPAGGRRRLEVRVDEEGAVTVRLR